MTKRIRSTRAASLLLTCAIASQFLTACGGSSTPNTSNLPPVDDSNRQAQSAPAAAPAEHHGMSNGQKAALLVGAAALFYIYNKNQQAHKAGNTTEPQYYLSKNGRVYYREKGGRVHWVTPPAGGIQVPREEAAQYEQYQGYDGRTTGRDLAGIGTTQE